MSVPDPCRRPVLLVLAPVVVRVGVFDLVRLLELLSLPGRPPLTPSKVDRGAVEPNPAFDCLRRPVLAGDRDGRRCGLLRDDDAVPPRCFFEAVAAVEGPLRSP